MKNLSLTVLLSLFISILAFSQISIEKGIESRGIVYLNENPNTKQVLEQNNVLPLVEIQTIKIDQDNSFLSNDPIKSIVGSEILFPNEYAAFYLDKNTKEINFIKPTYSYDASCEMAIKRSPKWMREDLHRAFRNLAIYNLDDNFAALINNAHPSIVDEVAFQIAYLSLETLKDSRFRSNIDLLVNNAQFIYDVVDSLKYVRLKEYGSFSSGDYYTTTEYRIKDGASGDTIWSEIPKEIYYWYVVMPKIDREGVYRQDLASSTQFRTYGYFWKDYLWYNPSKAYDYTKVNITTPKGSIDTIQRFGAIMQQPEILWNRVQTYFPFKRSFDPEDHALDILGNWASRSMPVDAAGNRPFTPQQAINEHNGNCHEDAILVAAACRTALIPIIHLGVHGEDHAFGMIWDEDWYHYEFFRGGFSEQINSSFAGITNMLDKGSYGWTSSIALGSRPDGFLENLSSYYTDKTCTLKVQVTDKNNKPVDGAKVEFWCSPGPYSSGWMDNVGFFWTDHTGIVEIEVGAGKKYAYQVYHEDFGYIPSSDKANILTTTTTIDGGTYSIVASFTDKEMPALKYGKLMALPNTADFGVHINFTSFGVVAGQNLEDIQNSTFAYKLPDDGSLSFFLLDQANYDKFKTNEEFDYYFPVKYFNSGNLFLPLPDGDKWYVVFSNQEATNNYQQLDATVELMSDAVWGEIPELSIEEINIYPNPFTDYCKISVPAQTEKVEIYDLLGNLITRMEQSPYKWQPISETAKGIYLVKIYVEDQVIVEKVVIK